MGLCQREWNKYPTILSGDINQPGDINDNSYHVVVGADNAVLDGFTITGGNADGSGSYGEGAGIYCYSVSPVISNCVITDNSSTGLGGGISYCYCDRPIISNCVFAGNSSIGGGAIGIIGDYDIHVSPSITNCVFTDNAAICGGGAIIIFGGITSAQVINCTFFDNHAYIGGALATDDCKMQASNCIFWANTATYNDQIYSYYEYDCWKPPFSHCDIQDSNGSGENWDSSLGIDAGGNIDADPNFTDPCDPDGPDDLWATADDGLAPGPKSLCINAADFWLPPPRTDVTSRVRRNVSPYPDIGAYESKYKIMLVMCFIDETWDLSYYDPENKQMYYDDMDDFNDLLAGFPYYATDYSILKAGCIVPPFYNPLEPPEKYWHNIADVLPAGFFVDPCNAPEILWPEENPVGLSIAECNRPPTGAELIAHFHRIRENRGPDCILRLADKSPSLNGFGGLGNGYEYGFVPWLEGWLRGHGLDPADTSVLPKESDGYFWDEWWIKAVTEDVNEIVNP